MELTNKEEKIETYEQPEIKPIIKESSAKTFRGLLLGKIQIAKNAGNIYLQTIYEDLLNDYDNFNNITVQVDLKSWKGTDQVAYIETVDRFIITTHQKPDQNSEPVEHKKEIMKDYVNDIIEAINTAKISRDKKGNQFIKTRDIAERHAVITNMYVNPEGNPLWNSDNIFIWQLYFGSRFLHTTLNLILRLLDAYLVIRYRRGRTVILNNQFKFQTNL